MPVSQVYLSRWFQGFAKREQISNEMLLAAVDRMEQGLVDADLGGGVIKQRIARKGQGKSGGYRVFIAARKEERAVFIYGFAKGDMGNIGPDDLREFGILAEDVLSLFENGKWLRA